MRKLALASLLILLFAVSARGQSQGGRYDTSVTSNTTGLPVQGAYVRVCTQPTSGTPCNTPATIYSDVNLTVPIANPTTTDQYGDAYFYAATGRYTVEFYGQGLADKQLPDQNISLPLTLTPTFTTVEVTSGVILDGSTSGTITLAAPAIAGTNTATFPAATGNVLLDAATQSVSGKTFAQNILPDTAGRTVGSNALPYAGIYIGGAATNNIDLTGTATAARTATLPNNTGTLAELNLAQTWTETQTFPSASIPPGAITAGTNGQCLVTSSGTSQWGSCSTSGFANLALSNLSGVAINASLVPGAAATLNLGSAALPWANLFVGNAANQTVTLGVSGLSANRTLTVPDNSGTIGETNLAQTWSAAQTYSAQLVSTVSTGTAPFSITSTTLVSNLNVGTWGGVTISGTPSGGMVPTATSSTAATWQAPSYTSVVAFCSTSLASSVNVTSSATQVTSVSCTMPSAGCPCRAFVSYSLYLNFSGFTNEDEIAFWVNDGSAVFAGVQTGQSNASSGARTMAATAAFSSGTYSNSQVVTFHLYGQLPASQATVEAAPDVGSGPHSSMQVAVFTST